MQVDPPALYHQSSTSLRPIHNLTPTILRHRAERGYARWMPRAGRRTDERLLLELFKLHSIKGLGRWRRFGGKGSWSAPFRQKALRVLRCRYRRRWGLRIWPILVASMWRRSRLRWKGHVGRGLAWKYRLRQRMRKRRRVRPILHHVGRVVVMRRTKGRALGLCGVLARRRLWTVALGNTVIGRYRMWREWTAVRVTRDEGLTLRVEMLTLVAARQGMLGLARWPAGECLAWQLPKGVRLVVW